MTVITSTNVTKKDIINMQACSVSLKDANGEEINVSGVAVCEDINEKGETVRKGFIIAPDGTVFGTVSATAIRSIDGIADLLSDGENVTVSVDMRTSKNDRDFIVLTVK